MRPIGSLGSAGLAENNANRSAITAVLPLRSRPLAAWDSGASMTLPNDRPFPGAAEPLEAVGTASWPRCAGNAPTPPVGVLGRHASSPLRLHPILRQRG